MAQVMRFTRAGESPDLNTLHSELRPLIGDRISVKLLSNAVDIYRDGWDGINTAEVQNVVTNAPSANTSSTARRRQAARSDTLLLAICEYIGQRELPPRSGTDVRQDIIALIT